MRRAAPHLKGAIGTACVHPDNSPPPDHAATTDRLTTRTADRWCPNLIVRACHRRCLAASTPVAAEPRVPATSSMPHRLRCRRRRLPHPDAAVTDSAW
jgi:hypothetical protein